jgi:hypothetical protein
MDLLVLLFEIYLKSCKNELNGFRIELPNNVATSQGKNPINLSVFRERLIKLLEHLYAFNLKIQLSSSN